MEAVHGKCMISWYILTKGSELQCGLDCPLCWKVEVQGHPRGLFEALDHIQSHVHPMHALLGQPEQMSFFTMVTHGAQLRMAHIVNYSH